MNKILSTKEAIKVKTYSGSGNRQFSGGRNPGRIYYSSLQLVAITAGKKITYQLLLTQITYQIDSIIRRNKIEDIKKLPPEEFEKFVIKEIKRSSPRLHPKRIVGTFTDLATAQSAFLLKGKSLK